jgi:hypothetical protein
MGVVFEVDWITLAHGVRNLVHMDWMPLISKPPSDGEEMLKNTIYIYSDDYKTITKIILRIYKIKTGSCNQVNCRSLQRSVSWRRFNSGLPTTIGDNILLTALANLLGLSLAMMSRRSLCCIQQEHAVAALLAQELKEKSTRKSELGVTPLKTDSFRFTKIS